MMHDSMLLSIPRSIWCYIKGTGLKYICNLSAPRWSTATVTVHLIILMFLGNARFAEPDDATALDGLKSDASWQCPSNGWVPKWDGKHPRSIRFVWHTKFSYGHLQSASGANGSTRTNDIHSRSKLLPGKPQHCLLICFSYLGLVICIINVFCII